jgi:DNA-binding SARP family transcriptional activator
MRIHCQLLGPVVATADEGAVPTELLQRKNLALLVYIARSPRQTRTREHLTGIFWAEKPEAKARHSLREAVRILRRYLGEEGLIADGDRIALAPGVVRLDTDELDDLESAGDWEAAATLVRGEFLEGFSVRDAWQFEEWLGTERALWRRRSVTALAAYAEQLLAAGRTREAVEASLQAHALDPGSSTALRGLLRSLALAGERTEALGLFARYAEHLKQVGAEPDGETLELVERVRRERAWILDESVPTAEQRGAELRRAPLVGRETEMARLVEAWSATLQGRSAGACFIVGDPGCGKTRLGEELAARARLDGATLATLRAVESDATQPGAVLLGLARSGLLEGPGLATASPTALGAFASHIPEWADRFGVPSVEPLPPADAFVEVVRALAHEQPVFLWVDDAHWGDREGLLALSAVLRDLADMPVHLCISLAPQPPRPELDELRSRLGRDLAGTAVSIDVLPQNELRLLVRWAVPAYSDDEADRLARRVASDSAGLPLLAVELLHAVALGLDLAQTESAWPRPLQTLSQSLPGDLPDAIVAAIRVGFRRLSPAAQTVAAAAAVLGDRVTTGWLELATGLEDAAVHRALDELEWQRWLAADALGYSFVARIVREVIARDMITAGQRRRFRQAVESGK